MSLQQKEMIIRDALSIGKYKEVFFGPLTPPVVDRFWGVHDSSFCFRYFFSWIQTQEESEVIINEVCEVIKFEVLNNTERNGIDGGLWVLSVVRMYCIKAKDFNFWPISISFIEAVLEELVKVSSAQDLKEKHLIRDINSLENILGFKISMEKLFK